MENIKCQELLILCFLVINFYYLKRTNEKFH